MTQFKYLSRSAQTQPLLWLLLGCMLWLTACSGSDSSSQPPNSTQPLKFAQSGTAKLITGERYANPATGNDAGSASYRSSNLDVATVDDQGTVLAQAAGTATITATTQSDRRSYRVDVVNRSATLGVWLGTDNSALELSSGMEGTELFAASEADCDFDQYTGCEGGVMDFIAAESEPLLSQTPKLNSDAPGYFQLRHGNHRANSAISYDRFSGVYEHQATYFNGQFWVIGGTTKSDTLTNEVYSSNDGLNWVKRMIQTEDGGEIFSARYRHSVVAYKNQLWLVGGLRANGGELSDVWSSKDGVTWKQVLDDGQVEELGRRDYQAVVFDAPNDDKGERLWLVGGKPLDDSRNVWVTDNGADWEKVDLKGDPLPKNTEHQVVVFDAQGDSDGAKLWFIGGDSDVTAFLSSADGVKWENFSAKWDGDKALPGYKGHQVVVYQNKLWLIGGGTADRSTTSDVWSSTNGTDWHLETDQATFPKRAYHQVEVTEDRLWLIGGLKYEDVWTSTDGITWTQPTNEAEFSARTIHQVITFDGGTGEKLWLIGGMDGEPSNDIWISSDGLNWTKQVINKESSIFSPRHGHQVAVFDGELWLVGGYGKIEGQDSAPLSDVWSSADGINWVNRTEDTNATFIPRFYHQLVVFDDGSGDALFLIGGWDGYENFRNDVWKLPSLNKNWIQLDDFSNCIGISEHQAVVFDNKLWVIGGVLHNIEGCGEDDVELGHTNMVWSLSKDDDSTWSVFEQGDSEVRFSARTGHQVTVFDNELWLVGGFNSLKGEVNDVWKSTNGTIWIRVTEQADFPPRRFHQLIAFNDELWVIGGYDHNMQKFYNDIWKSTDGEHWRHGIKTRFNFRD